MVGPFLILCALGLAMALLVSLKRSEKAMWKRTLEENARYQESIKPLEPDTEFGPLKRRFARSHLAVTLRLPCPPYGDLEMDVQTADVNSIAQSSRKALKELMEHWPSYWDTAKVAFEGEVDAYGNSDAWTTSKALLRHELLDAYSLDSTILLALEFEPFAGYYDVTFTGDTILDCGAAF